MTIDLDFPQCLKIYRNPFFPVYYTEKLSHWFAVLDIENITSIYIHM